MKLSIIVPVYNVREYIVKCLSSLVQQECDDYEILIINDGTKDDSIQLIEQNFETPKIRIHNQENMGLSEARNNGMQLARGEYIWFFDSDDWVSDNVVSKIISNLNNIDLLYFTSYYTETGKVSKITNLGHSYTNGKDLSFDTYFHGAPFYIYKKDFLLRNHFKFKKGIYHEDSLFTPQVLYQSNNIRPFDIPVYHRLIRENSITQTVNPKRCYDLQYIILEHDKFCQEFIKNKKDRLLWGHCIADNINGLLYQGIFNDIYVKNDIKSFFNEHKSLVKYLCHSPKFFSRLLGYICKITNLPLFDVYRFVFRIRYGIK